MFKLAILIVSSPSSGDQTKIKTEIMIEHHYKGTRNTFCPLLYELRLKVMQENGFLGAMSWTPAAIEWRISAGDKSFDEK